MSTLSFFLAQLSRSVKIEQSAIGARVTIHLLANAQPEAIGQASNTDVLFCMEETRRRGPYPVTYRG